MSLNGVRWVDIPTIRGEGCVSFLQKGQPLPFEPRRMYYLHDIPKDVVRGAHAHKELQQLIWAINGSFTLMLDDGRTRQEFVMNDPTKGLYLPSGLWRELSDFKSGTVCVVMASLEYDEADYIRDYDDFKAYVAEQEGK
ncbi:MAG: WxcM-like domain-containing protein [Blastochloris viridis]|uniref:WxcM-like domain-containing protein n=1 Tax=Blastochloris viridis TaxID=1079 RepID=A0A6N4RDJ0_BLAVI|nr:MAG: WxcM-like domain-containing protein [Blastochloris viridis]